MQQRSNSVCHKGRLKVFLENGKLIVNTTPVEEIVYYTDSQYTPGRSQSGNDLTRGEYTIMPTDTFVRVEVKDKNGRYACETVTEVLLIPWFDNKKIL